MNNQKFQAVIYLFYQHTSTNFSVASCHETSEKAGTGSPSINGKEKRDETPSKSNSEERETLQDAEEAVTEDFPRKRRAATKVTSYKEDDINR